MGHPGIYLGLHTNVLIIKTTMHFCTVVVGGDTFFKGGGSSRITVRRSATIFVMGKEVGVQVRMTQSAVKGKMSFRGG